MSRLAIRDEIDVQAWSLPMFDRMGLVMSRLRDKDLPQAVAGHIDPLRDLRVGLNLAALKHAADEFPIGVQAILRRVVHEVSDTYDRYARGRQLMNASWRPRSTRQSSRSPRSQPRLADAMDWLP